MPRPIVDVGILSDLEMLLEVFLESGSLRLTKFYELIGKLELDKIFCGRLNASELIEFEECLLRVAFTYSAPCKYTTIGLRCERSIPERIFGIYMTYVLYYAQPSDYFSKIQAKACDLVELRRFAEEVISPLRYLDAVACVYELVADDAFSIVPYNKCYEMACRRRATTQRISDEVVDEDEKYKSLSESKSVFNSALYRVLSSNDIRLTRLLKRILKPGDVIDKEYFLFKTRRLYGRMKERIGYSCKLDDDIGDDSVDLLHIVRRADEDVVLPRGKIAKKPRISIKNGAYSSKLLQWLAKRNGRRVVSIVANCYVH